MSGGVDGRSFAKLFNHSLSDRCSTWHVLLWGWFRWQLTYAHMYRHVSWCWSRVFAARRAKGWDSAAAEEELHVTSLAQLGYNHWFRASEVVPPCPLRDVEKLFAKRTVQSPKEKSLCFCAARSAFGGLCGTHLTASAVLHKLQGLSRNHGVNMCKSD